MSTVKTKNSIKFRDEFAATYIVGNDLFASDFLTIQDAINNFPPEGGKIFLLQGSYPFTPVATLPANLKIVGAGNLASEIVLGGALTFGLGDSLEDVKISGAFTVSLGVEFEAVGARFASPVVIPVGADRVSLIGNRFEAIALRSIDIVAGSEDAIIQGNFFIGFTSEAIRTEGLSAVITENQNCKVVEIGAADLNRYDDNMGFSGSTIIGADSVVNDARRKGVTGGATTGAFVNQFTHTNPKGLLGIGTIQNTGGVNSMEVREEVTDAFGNVSSMTTTVVAGNNYMLDPQTNIGAAFPPYLSYGVSVRHPVAATTFDLQFVTHGAIEA